MENLNQKHQSGEKTEVASDRRDFVKNAGKVAAVAPAVALLLSVDAKSNLAFASSGGSSDDVQPL